jgi:hypothetical protein
VPTESGPLEFEGPGGSESNDPPESEATPRRKATAPQCDHASLALLTRELNESLEQQR